MPNNIYSLTLGRIKEVLAACLNHEPIHGWRIDGSINELAEEGFPREAWLATCCGAADRGISDSAACLSSLPASAVFMFVFWLSKTLAMQLCCTNRCLLMPGGLSSLLSGQVQALEAIELLVTGLHVEPVISRSS